MHTVWHNIFSYSCKPVLYSLNNGPEQLSNVYLFAIANAKYFGGGMKVSPTADPYDSKFDITLMENVSVFQVMTFIFIFYFFKQIFYFFLFFHYQGCSQT